MLTTHYEYAIRMLATGVSHTNFWYLNPFLKIIFPTFFISMCRCLRNPRPVPHTPPHRNIIWDIQSQVSILLRSTSTPSRGIEAILIRLNPCSKDFY